MPPEGYTPLTPAEQMLLSRMQHRDYVGERRKEMVDEFTKRMCDDMGIEHTIDIPCEVIETKRLNP